MSSRKPEPAKLVSNLSVDTALGAFLGGTRIRLLEAIDQSGSISQAAKAVPLSYKAAWDAVDAMNNLAEQPLVERSVGGKHGGGTTLTPYGRKLVAMYRAVEAEYQGALDRLSGRLGDADAADVRQFQSMLRRMALKTSARNQFVGKISGLRESGVSIEVTVRIDERNEITATVTNESAENLGLRLGMEITALVKASAVGLAADGEGQNRLQGEVARIDPASRNAEVTVVLPGGRNVTALVSPEDVAALGLAAGTPVCAIFPPAAVILVAFD